VARRNPWAGFEQPTLASEQAPPEAFEAGRVTTTVVPLTAETSTAAALVHAGGCAPQCLISAGVPIKLCDCACRGAYHGVLADADIRSALHRREATTYA
jgi:hypothetical protein